MNNARFYSKEIRHFLRNEQTRNGKAVLLPKAHAITGVQATWRQNSKQHKPQHYMEIRG